VSGHLAGRSTTSAFQSSAETLRSQPADQPWLTASEAARRARCGVKVIYGEVKRGRLKAARVGGRRELRFLAEWVDAWLLATTTAVTL
jgi:excisionase family DNA binding protein